MTDDGIGRLLVASLHQGIADAAPGRLDFYEHWLRPAEGGEARATLASLGAVLSFLRKEGQPVYDAVMARAGAHAADWTVQEMPAFERRLIQRLPSPLRARLALRVCRRLVRGTFLRSKTAVQLRRGAGSVAIHDSVFCTLRTSATAPMCVFYAAGVERLLASFEVPGRVTVGECRAEGAALCRLLVTVGGSREETPPAEAA